jgi:hypothetical protein
MLLLVEEAVQHSVLAHLSAAQALARCEVAGVMAVGVIVAAALVLADILVTEALTLEELSRELLGLAAAAAAELLLALTRYQVLAAVLVC